MRFIWKKKEKTASKPLTEQEIQKHLYGSYGKTPENEKAAYAESIKQEFEKEKEKLERKKEDLRIEKENEFNRRKTAEQNLSSAKAELEQNRKKLFNLSKKNFSLKKALSETRQALTGTIPAEEIPAEAIPARKVFKIISNFLPKRLILFPAILLVLLLVIFASGKIFSLKEETPLTADKTPKLTAPVSLYTIQICVYEKEGGAQELVNKLKTKGYRAHFAPKISPKGKKNYNIYIGRFSTKKQAAAFLNKLKNNDDFTEFTDSFVRKI